VEGRESPLLPWLPASVFLQTIHLAFHPARCKSAVRAAARAVKLAVVVRVTNPGPDPTVGVERRLSGAKQAAEKV
jgi:hypothetical protein